MTREFDFITSLRAIAGSPAARQLLDDAAVLKVGGTQLVLTHDMIVEGVHFLSDDPPGDVAWKLVAVNLSDLAAKGARPLGLLMGYTLGREPAWDQCFVEGLERALTTFGVALLGGDTVSSPPGSPRTLGLTAIGEATAPVPSRSGARAGDLLWVSGSIGDAGAGLAIAKGERNGPLSLVERYRLPLPRLDAGRALAPLATAMMDVSDGLLIDALRMVDASGMCAAIDLDLIPLSSDLRAFSGQDRAARLAAATAGDDYELLFTAAPRDAPRILAASRTLSLPLTVIGSIEAGSGLKLTDGAGEVPLPDRLGWQHDARDCRG